MIEFRLMNRQVTVESEQEVRVEKFKDPLGSDAETPEEAGAIAHVAAPWQRTAEEQLLVEVYPKLMEKAKAKINSTSYFILIKWVNSFHSCAFSSHSFNQSKRRIIDISTF